MSDLNAIQRIIDACEGQPSGSPTRFDATVDVAEAAVSRAMEVINHLLSPSLGLPTANFVGRDGYDLVIAPTLLASMLRAARGESVTVGRLVFAGHTVLRRRVAEIADMLRCSTWRRVDGVHKKLVDLVATWEAP